MYNSISVSITVVLINVYVNEILLMYSIFFSKVEAVKQSYFELRPVKPRLKRLRERLEENVYDGNIMDDEADQKRHKAIH